MRKAFLLLIVFILIYNGIYCQEIGLRIGNIVGNDIAVDGVFQFKNSRIHADVSFGDGIGVEALYDFLFRSIEKSDVYYYIGAGAFTWLGDHYFGLGASSEFGLEYRFPMTPIALGIDVRPSLLIIEDVDLTFSRFGFNARWVF